VLDLAGIAMPAEIESVKQSTLDGTSFANVVLDPALASPRTTQYFEMLTTRGIYQDGWKAVAFHPLGAMYNDGLDPDAPYDDDVWELYNVAVDRAETNDLAGEEPGRLQKLIDLWWSEAERNYVLPLDNRPLAAIMNPRPSSRALRGRYVYYPHGAPIPEAVAVTVRNRSHTITARVRVVAGVEPSGVILAMGNVLGGFSFHLHNGNVRYVHNLYGKQRDVITSDVRVGDGEHTLAFAFEKTGDFTGEGTLLVDGEAVGSGVIPHFTPVRFSITGQGITCGYEAGPAVGDDYEAPFTANVEIAEVVVDVSGRPYRDPEGEFEAMMSEQ
jgi:arylsulfatase